MLFEGGLLAEWHAQNVLYGFDKSWHCVATVLRDMESIERDFPLMRRAGRSTQLASYPYKCLDADSYNYQIKHSFLFDHKLGEYLLQPIIDHALRVWSMKHNMIDQTIVDVVMEEMRRLPRDFFPEDNSWYKFANDLIDQSRNARPYVRFENPRFRRPIKQS